jgi:hypothetical protein
MKRRTWAMKKRNKRHVQESMIKKEEKRKKNRREMFIKGVHTPSTKNIHTPAHLDQGL